jgi:hypothetical protein
LRRARVRLSRTPRFINRHQCVALRRKKTGNQTGNQNGVVLGVVPAGVVHH